MSLKIQSNKDVRMRVRNACARENRIKQRSKEVKPRTKGEGVKVAWARAKNAHLQSRAQRARSDMHRLRKSSETGQEQAQRLK